MSSTTLTDEYAHAVDALELLGRHLLVGLVLEVLHLASDVVVAHQTEERRDGAVRSAAVAAVGDSGDQRFERQRLQADREQGDRHLPSI